jgi:NAD(P)-dependent dehydrogenase (short-subunit alcohol dehydrogenase family)
VELAGRAAIVTGAAAGIGRAVASALAAEDASVIVVDVDTRGGTETAKAVGGVFFKADLSVDAEVRAMIEFARTELGGLDVLVNNAGGVADEWQRTVDVNLRGLMLATRLAFDAMRGEGAIVNVSSVAGLGTRAHPAPDYAAAKAAVARFSAALAEHRGVRVNCVCPDWVDTPAVQRDLATMTEGERAAVPALVPVEEIAAIVLDLVRDDSVAGRIVARFADEPGPRLLPNDRRD